MRTRTFRGPMGLLAVAALIFGACSSAATPSPVPSAAPTTAPTTAASSAAPATATPAASSAAPSASSGASLKIGVVTDVGTVDDKNFNQFSYEGAVAGAADIGAAKPAVVVPNSSSDYATDINGFVSQNYNIIVTVGFNLTNATILAAKANPNIWFIGVDQAPLCITATGAPDTAATPTCAGDPAKLLPKFIAIKYEEDQAGYLAGIVAASVSKTGKIGAIGGINLVPAVVRYIQGYVLGAQSVNPNIKVDVGYVTTSDFGKAFNDPATGKTYATQFIQQKGDDVMFQVAGKTGNGVLQAACAANIVGIGVDVNQYLSLNAASDPAYKCILTSAEKHLSNSVESSIKQIAAGTAKGGNVIYNAASDGIGLAPFTPPSAVSASVQAKLDTALAAMKAGTLVTCPTKCGQP
ncbi:MAG TPA: BMP family ABC transporter substrate-binding protein [Candidatus Saccharimonadales bacterium]|nr:BMP family ABC transporter substrate-binding protein [Candidatus Saccharimonadales bacterium]